MTGVHLLGVAATPPARHPRAPRVLAREAVAAALADAGVAAAEVDGLAIASTDPGFGRGCSEALGGVRRPYRCHCGIGAVALHSSVNAIAAGAGEVVVCVGHDPGPGRAAAESSLETQAAGAREYMQHSGATEQHLAQVAAKNRVNGAANPHARVASPVDADEVLASELLLWPLRRLMIANAAEGVAAVVLASREAGRRLGPKAPLVRASVLLDEESSGGAAASRAARLAYLSAGIGPEEIDLAEVEDATPVDEIEAYEALELAPPGAGPELVESGFTALGGVVPVNASGGCLSHGRMPAAGSILQLVELAQQLRAQAGRRQVPGARVGAGLAGSATSSAGVTSMTIVSA